MACKREGPITPRSLLFAPRSAAIRLMKCLGYKLENGRPSLATQLEQAAREREVALARSEVDPPLLRQVPSLQCPGLHRE